jgi:hypothetical protein
MVSFCVPWRRVAHAVVEEWEVLPRVLARLGAKHRVGTEDVGIGRQESQERGLRMNLQARQNL